MKVFIFLAFSMFFCKIRKDDKNIIVETERSQS